MNSRGIVIALLVFVVSAFAQEKPKAPTEVKLTSGSILRRVEVVRYEPGIVVLKHMGGVDPINLKYIAEPYRSQLIAYQAVKEEADVDKRLEETRAEARRQLDEEDQRKNEEAIAEQKIRVGMTTEQVVRSWGDPIRKNRSGGSYGSREQWVYPGRVYIYFESGRLTSWQTSE